jgi:hypothetical protein
MPAQVEALYSLSILIDIYGLSQLFASHAPPPPAPQLTTPAFRVGLTNSTNGSRKCI